MNTRNRFANHLAFRLVGNTVLRFHRLVAISAQLLIIVASNWGAFLLRFDGDLPPEAAATFWQMIPLVVLVRAAAFVPFRLHEGLWRYTSIHDLQSLAAGVATSSAVLLLINQLPIGSSGYPRSVLLIDALLLLLLLGGLRMSRRIYAELSHRGRGKRVVIYGAGNTGELIVREMKSNPESHYRPVGLIDDDRSKVGGRIHGVPVLGTGRDLVAVVQRTLADEVLIAMPHAEPSTKRDIVRQLEPTKIPIKTLPNLHDILDGRVEIARIRNLAVEDLLSRAPVDLSPAPIRRLVLGRRVMVTGAGGSIGSELCRQIAPLKPSSLVLLDRYENTLHAVRVELEDAGLGEILRPVVADVTDEARARQVLDKYRPELVFHAAAHKHVPLMEENPAEAIKNNVFGTKTLVENAERYGVDRFILLSTDKAVNPTSIMGASKRVAELIVQAHAQSLTSFMTVRFGNVLASNGSVIPRLLEQIKRGGPLTITHPEMRRYFMLIPEAVQLVLHAAAQGESGVTYVLEMGEQIKLVDMARDLIRLSGFIPEDDIAIKFTGLRPGEKMSEELIFAEETALPSKVKKVYSVVSTTPLPIDLSCQIERLEAAATSGDPSEISSVLKRLIPGYGQEGTSIDKTSRDLPPLVAPDTVFSVQDICCPSCGAPAVHRSRARNMFERAKRRLTPQRLYQCDTCKWRGWLQPLEFASGLETAELPPPDLSSLDAIGPSHSAMHAPAALRK